MAQIFSRRATFLFRFALIALPVAVLLVGAVMYGMYGSARLTRPGSPTPQPVDFRHDQHVASVGLDCRYCHAAVEESAFAGIPSVKTCLGCHEQIWRHSPLLAPVHSAAAGGPPLRWNRVTNLPDFTVFDHSIHVAKGFGCDTCHGRVDLMPRVWQVRPFHMAWCVDCHRNPEQYVRPREEVFNMQYEPPRDQMALGAKLVAEYGIRRVTDCTACHY